MRSPKTPRTVEGEDREANDFLAYLRGVKG
jgi:hypothetical protein